MTLLISVYQLANYSLVIYIFANTNSIYPTLHKSDGGKPKNFYAYKTLLQCIANFAPYSIV